MYSEWASLQQDIQTNTSNVSVLHRFPETVGREVAGVVVKNLAQSLNVSAQNGEPSYLYTDKEVKWTMEVLCYGLSLPLSEHDTIKDCVNVYCDWLTALTNARRSVPRPIVDDPNPYVTEMLQHLYNLFVPKYSTVPDQVHRQPVLCHRVLRIIQNSVTASTVMDRDTWECLLKFLLAINDTLLAPPLARDSIGENLCERILSVLFEMWILACLRSFPSPPLWKTFRDMCCKWRHHEALVLQWHKVNVTFLARLLKFTYGPTYPELQIMEEDKELIPEAMDNDCIAQCWFRFLHMLGSPVDLSRPHVISSTPKFLHHALTSEVLVDPEQHECLQTLPQIFHKAMRSVSVLVDAFLGLSQQTRIDADHLTTPTDTGRMKHSQSFGHAGSTPPAQRRPKSTIGAPSNKGSKASLTTQRAVNSAASLPSSSPCHVTLDGRPPLAPKRPKVNSILHLFGSWLIEAGLVGVKVHGTSHKDDQEPINRYAAGRAEACGALCRIFCSHKTGEDILPVYLSRFYIVLYYGLQVNHDLSGPVLANVIFNSCDLLRVDLDGVLTLLPQMIRALELILNDLTPKFKYDEQIPPVELRKASIHILLSMLCLPLHFKTLTIRSIFGDKSTEPVVTFLSLKMRIIELLLRALTVESDSANTQMLLGGLLLCVQDMALCEEAEQTMQQEEKNGGAPPSPLAPDTAALKVKVNAEQNYPETSLQRSSQLREFDSAFGLFGHAASLVCHRLMASWKMDLNIALAAIEVLSGLAKIPLNRPNVLMCKRTVNWICEFIVYQCSRPAPSHSKDLHSMIVAAFHCLTLWLVEHSYLLQDKECLQGVLEVVELGISGSKSQVEPGAYDVPDYHPVAPPVKHKHGKGDERDRHHGSTSSFKHEPVVVVQHRASDVPKLKSEKELKPVSMRVKEAAEGLLTVIMDHVGSFPPPCGPESICSLLDEDTLLKHCKEGGLPDEGTPFRYFVLEGTTVVGLYEQPLGNDQDPLPTVTALIRGPFGRHAWTMQLRHQPRQKKTGSRGMLSEASRPQPKDDVGVYHHVKHQYFPESVDQIELVQADRSIPPLESTMTDAAAELQKLEGFILKQVAFESTVTERVMEEQKQTTFPNKDTECTAPSVSSDFQTARLFLSHYGFLSLEALKEQQGSSVPPSLVMLDTPDQAFLGDLEQLDCIPSRSSDTVHMFYVKAGQKMPFEILNNVTAKPTVEATFLEFLRSLGWPVDVKKHAGWTGHCSTSWKIQPTEEEDELYPGDTGGSLYDGRKQVLYWADVSSEVAFVVPSPDTYQPIGRRSSTGSQSDKSPGASSNSSGMDVSTKLVPLPKVNDLGALKHKSMSLDLEVPPTRILGSIRDRSVTPTEGATGPSLRRFGRAGSNTSIQDTKIFVVWLESYEDRENFPAAEMFPTTSIGVEWNTSTSSLGRQMEPPLYLIFIHALQNGLFRVHLQGHVGKISMAIPLVDGMVVSRRSLGPMVRQTAINLCRRKRLESDAFQPPHVRRKLKIKELVDKYRSRLSEPEFYTALFHNNTH